MEKINKLKVSKKIMAILIIILTLISNVSPIFAASGTGNWVGGQYTSGLITTDSYNGGSGILIRKLIDNSTGEAITVFCAEHGTEFKTDRVYSGEYSTPPTEDLKNACKVAYFGWYGKHGDYLVNGGMMTSEWLWLQKDYVFTQQYIWEIQGQSNGTFVDSDVQSEYEDFKNTINSQMAQMKTRPSFEGERITIQLGEDKILTDSNGVLSDYNTVDTTIQGVRITHIQGENTLKINATADAEESIILTDRDFKNIGMIKAESTDYDTSIYFSFDSGVQAQLYTLHYNDPVPMSLRLSVEKFGRLELSKLDTEHNLIDGSVFNVTGPDGYNQDVTVTNGKIVVENLKKGTYTIKEKSTGTGYLLNTNSYTVEVNPNETSCQAIVNDEPLGKIKIYKVSENNDKIAGAKIKVVAAENITNKAGTKTYYTEGEEVAIITTAEGTGVAELDNLPMGKFKCFEVEAPEGYLINNTIYEANLVYKDSNTPVVELKIEGMVDTEPTGKVRAYKVSENNDKIDGAVFVLRAKEKITNKAGTKTYFEKGQEVTRKTTSNGGMIEINDLPLGKYELFELQAPEGYLLNETIYEVNLVYKDDSTPVVEIKIEGIVDKEPTGEIGIFKKDSKTGTIAQGDATLEGAVYKVYADEDIYNVAGSKKFYSKGDLVATRTTNKKGECEKITNLPLGKFLIKEEQPPLGYLLDKKEYRVDLQYEDQYTEVITGDANSTDKVKEMRLHIFKSGIKINSGKTPGLEGAKFNIKLLSAVEKAYSQGYTYEEVWNGIDEYGNEVEVDSRRVAEAQIIAPSYETIVTDENGDAYTTNPLPYGKFIVKETETPIDYETASDFTFSITEDESEIVDIAKKVKTIVVNNEQTEAYIKLVKKDLKTDKIVTLSNATFQIKATKDIYDRATGKIFYKKGEAVTQKIGSTTFDSFTTNAKNLVVPTNSYNNTFDRLGTVVTPLKLEVGSYEISEIRIPEGFLILEEPVTFKIESIKNYDKDQDGDYIKEIIIKNEQPTGTLILDKTIALREDADTSLIDTSDLSKIKFKLTAKENIIDYADGSIIYKKGQEVGIYNLDEKGNLRLTELPMGEYQLLEVETLDGLVLNDKVYDVKFIKQDDLAKVYTEELNIENETTMFEFSKTDITGDKELVGAKLTVIDKDGNVIDTWISTEKTHKIEGLKVGETFTLREEIAPDSFVKASDIKFKVESTSKIQKVTMVDKVVEMSKVDIAGEEIEGALMQVFDKDNNLVDEWTSEIKPHKIKNLIEGEKYLLHEELCVGAYVKATDAEFEVSLDKDTQKITMVDKLVDIVKTDFVTGEELEGAELIVTDLDGNVIDSWISKKEPHHVIGLEENTRYLLTEITQPYGFEVAETIEFEVTNEKINQLIEMKDMPILKTIKVIKIDSETEEIITEDFKFGIYEDENCTELIKEVEANKETGTITFEDLRYGIFYIKEIVAPKNYILSNKIVKIEINDDGVFADGQILEENESAYTIKYSNDKIPEIQTGNETNYIFLTISMIISLLVTTIGIVVLKRNDKKSK
ncbi:MAG: hypothetical protein J6M60_00575 [Clostridia bacterium]|nr:hypothetical protein [Clostridia bacterium]